MKKKSLLFVLLFVFAIAANATTYYVRSTGGLDTNDGLDSGSPFLTLGKAFDLPALSDGDVIDISGTFTYATSKNFTKSITIQGTDKSTAIVLGVTDAYKNCFNFGSIDAATGLPTSTPNITIENVTFQNFDYLNAAGTAGYGGALYVQVGVTLSCRNVDFINNQAYSGGAVFAKGGTLTFEDCKFKNNRAKRIDGSFSGGGAINAQAAVNMGSPAVVNTNNLILVLDRCLFDGNTSDFIGSAVRFETLFTNESIVPSLQVQNCTFTANKITSLGNQTGGSVHINAVSPATYVKLINNTIAYNNSDLSVAGSIAGINVITGASANKVTLINNILFSNFNAETTPISVSLASSVNLKESRNNIIDSNFDFTAKTTDGATMASGNVNSVTSGQLLLAANLTNNGGTTNTLSLGVASVAVNAGYVIGTPTTDQRNVTRDGTPDVGAFEIAAITYYVRSIGGLDTNDGLTPGSPFLTLGKVFDLPALADGDVIDISGTFTYATSKNLTKSITIQGTDKSTAIVQGVTGAYKNCFNFGSIDAATGLPTSTPNITIENVTFQNFDYLNAAGTAGYGGALYVQVGVTLSCRNVDFINNQAYTGGAVFAKGGVLTFEDCYFKNNKAKRIDGLYSGGGAINAQAAVTMGIPAVPNTNNLSLVLDRCLFDGNTSDYLASAIRFETLFTDVSIAPGLQVQNCTFTANKITSLGNQTGGSVHINAVSPATDVKLLNNTIAYNNSDLTVAGSIAGINIITGASANKVTLINNILFSNFNAETTPISVSLASSVNLKESRNNIIDSNFDFTAKTTDGATMASGNVNSVTSGQLLLDTNLINNVGETNTLSLGAGSVAVNTGYTISTPTVDQRNVARDGFPDVGAFEIAAITYYVRSTGGLDTNNGLSPGSPFLTLGKAFDLPALADGDVIDILGTFTYATSKNLTKSITIQGTDKSTAIVQGVTGAYKNCFNFGSIDAATGLPTSTPTITIENVTFQNFDYLNAAGTAGYGGALYVQVGVTLTCRNVDFINNLAYTGGAVFAKGGVLTFEDCYFKNNRAKRIDGLYSGGGAINAQAAVTMGSPAVPNTNNLSLVLDRCLFDGNTSDYLASAIRFETLFTDVSIAPGLLVQNCTFTANKITSLGNHTGGSIHINAVSPATDVKLINNTIAYNNSDLTVAGSISGINIITGASANKMTLINNILFSNFNAETTPISISLASSVNLKESRNNIIDSDFDFTAKTTNGATMASGNVNSVTSGQLLLAANLANNGGATKTLSLGAGSVAINAGYGNSAPAVDQRNTTRIGIPDAGSYEAAFVCNIIIPITSAIVDSCFNNKCPQNLHPRLFYSSSDIQRIKMLVLTDVAALSTYNSIIASANNLLSQPVLQYGLDAGNLRITNIHIVVNSHIPPLVLAYQFTGDTIYAKRCWDQLAEMMSWPDWGANRHFLDVGIGSTGFAMAYDGLYDYLTTDKKTQMVAAARNFALVPGLTQMKMSTYNWSKADSNWNGICHGGLIDLALSMYETDNSFMSDVISYATNGMILYIETFEPDGASPEGNAYWDYGLTHTCLSFDAMNRNLSTTFGLTEQPGFKKTGWFPFLMSGPVGTASIGDDLLYNTKSSRSLSRFWFAKNFNDANLAKAQYDITISKFGLKLNGWMDLLNYDPILVAQGAAVLIPMNGHLRGVDYMFVRENETDDSFYIGMHDGHNNANHGHLDAGNFYLHAKSKVFVTGSLGTTSPYPADYFDTSLPVYDSAPITVVSKVGRFSYYRVRPEGKSCLVFNPDARPMQNPLGVAVEEHDVNDATGGYYVTNLTDNYSRDVTSYRRGISLNRATQVTSVQDEFTPKTASTVYWIIQTPAIVSVSSLDKKIAKMTIGTKSIYAIIKTPANAEFEYVPSSTSIVNYLAETQPSFETIMAGKDLKNGLYGKLQFKLTGVTGANTIRVDFVSDSLTIVPDITPFVSNDTVTWMYVSRYADISTEDKEINYFTIYPNRLVSNVQGQIQFLSVLGKVVKSENINNGQVVQLPNGIYIVRIITTKGVFVKKIIL
jgi:predicted outer membrane repeat protein